MLTSHLRRRDQAEQRDSGEKGLIIVNHNGNELDMLTAQEVRDLTGVPISTLHDWASKRERGMEAPGPHHLRLSDRHRRWARRDVLAWLEAARV
jgi:predicted DNA-binding transcriptional regulator AlpA